MIGVANFDNMKSFLQTMKVTHDPLSAIFDSPSPNSQTKSLPPTSTQSDVKTEVPNPTIKDKSASNIGKLQVCVMSKNPTFFFI